MSRHGSSCTLRPDDIDADHMFVMAYRMTNRMARGSVGGFVKCPLRLLEL